VEKEIVINVAHEQTRVVMLEDGRVVSFHISGKHDQNITGNIYKGKVMKVIPGMQAAFVDIGLEKSAFLHVDDATAPMTFSPLLPESQGNDLLSNGTARLASLAAEDEVSEDSDEVTDDTDEAIDPSDQEAFVQIDEDAETVSENAVASESASEATSATPARPQLRMRSRRRKARPIEALLKAGQEIMVQVSKGPIGTKGPRVTMEVSLPGRYLVSLPTLNHVGVSKRIAQMEERLRLREMIRKLRRPGMGYIVRTVSDNMSAEDIEQDMRFLESLWLEVLKQYVEASAPAILHNDVDLVFRTVRDLLTRDVVRLTIDSRKEYERILGYVSRYPTAYVAGLTLWDEGREVPVFEAKGIETALTRATHRKVWLKSGGYLVIDRTEALTVIDVNTGRYVGKDAHEETILVTNLEACQEIAYQLRLRNTGGIIVIDLIDMAKEKNREQVLQVLLEAFKTDKAKVRILKISDLGLVEMSRERTQEDLTHALCDPCPYCDGLGYLPSRRTVCHEVWREVRRMALSHQHKKLVIAAHPSLAHFLSHEEKASLHAFEQTYKKKVMVRADAYFRPEQYEIIPL